MTISVHLLEEKIKDAHKVLVTNVHLDTASF